MAIPAVSKEKGVKLNQPWNLVFIEISELHSVPYMLVLALKQELKRKRRAINTNIIMIMWDFTAPPFRIIKHRRTRWWNKKGSWRINVVYLEWTPTHESNINVVSEGFIQEITHSAGECILVYTSGRCFELKPFTNWNVIHRRLHRKIIYGRINI